jgi:hypothetical protein
MSPRIERVADWIGRTVTGTDGEKIGRLDDIVYSTGGEPLLGAVSTGLFGHRTSLVPLAEATLSPDHVAVPYSKSMVKDAPQLDAPDAMSAAVEDQAEIHYGLPERERTADERYVTAAEQARREAAAAEAAAQAERLEARADDLRSGAADARDTAAAATERADALDRERAAAEAEAQRARDEERDLRP